MAKNLVLDYIKQKINAENSSNSASPPKVITISREYGCPGIPIANELSKQLSAAKNIQWSVIDKQIINQAAEEFEVPPHLIDEIAKNQPKGVFEELFMAFTDVHLPSDVKVKKTIARILRTVALHGNVVILGQGGAVLTRDITKSLHIHLHASIPWRIKKVKILDNIDSNVEAQGKINIADKERLLLRNYYAGENLDDNIFDVSFNCEFLTEDQIVESILLLAKGKGI